MTMLILLFFLLIVSNVEKYQSGEFNLNCMSLENTISIRWYVSCLPFIIGIILCKRERDIFMKIIEKREKYG